MSVNSVGPRLRCMIVDDQPESVLDLMAMLKDHEDDLMVSETANTIDEAVDKATRIRPDILFLDVEMGKQTGFDMITRLQEPLPHVVFVSGMSHYSLQAIKANAVDNRLHIVIRNRTQAAPAPVDTPPSTSKGLQFMTERLKGWGRYHGYEFDTNDVILVRHTETEWLTELKLPFINHDIPFVNRP